MSTFFTTVVIIVIWYTSNIGLLLGNKWLLSSYGFKYPIFLTCLHMVSCTLMSYGAVVGGAVVQQRIVSRQQLIKVGSVALVFCASLVLANTSLRYIPVSFNQAVGSTTPAFTAVLSIAMLHKWEQPAVYWSLVPVVLGICIASGFEPAFNVFGFVCCITATAARAFKSVLQGILLVDGSERLDSMNLLLYMAPIAAVALVPLAALLEPDALGIAISRTAEEPMFALALLSNVFLAYFVNLANFLVTKHTSALTLQVLGNAKGVIAAGVSVMIFRNRLTPLGVFGYAITVGGVFMYSEVKRRQKAAGAMAAKLQGLGVGLGKGGESEPERVPLMMEAGGLKPLKHKGGDGGLAGGASPMSSPLAGLVSGIKAKS